MRKDCEEEINYAKNALQLWALARLKCAFVMTLSCTIHKGTYIYVKVHIYT